MTASATVGKLERHYRRIQARQQLHLTAKTRITTSVNAPVVDVPGGKSQFHDSPVTAVPQARPVVSSGTRSPARTRHDGLMAGSLETQFLRADLEVGCPACEYPIWVTGAEIVAQATVTCPCCRARIEVIDADGSFKNLGRDIERHIEQALKGLWQ